VALVWTDHLAGRERQIKASGGLALLLGRLRAEAVQGGAEAPKLFVMIAVGRGGPKKLDRVISDELLR
jgi:hypothetical protein